MKPDAGMLATVGFLLAAAPWGSSQNLPPIPPQGFTSGPSLSQLIDWSYLQQPRPTLQPAIFASPSAAQPRAQAFFGTILREGSTFVLAMPGSPAYRLDGQQEAERYEGVAVRIAGRPDVNNRTLQVESIEVVLHPQ